MNKYKMYFNEIIYLIGSDLRKIPILLFAFMASSFIDILGIGLIAPYVSMIISPDAFNYSFLDPYISWFGSFFGMTEKLSILGSLLIVAFVLKVLAAYFINSTIVRFSYHKGIQIRRVLMTAYQSLPYVEYLKRNSSEYIYSIVSLSSIFAQGTLQAILRILSEGIVLLAVLILLILNNGLPFIIFIFITGVILILFDFMFRKKLIKHGSSIDKYAKKMLQAVHESIEGLKEIRVLNKEEYFYNKVVDSAQIISNSTVSLTLIKVMPRYFVELALITFIVSLVLVTMAYDHSRVELAAMLSLFGAAAIRVIPSINHFLSGISTLSHNRNAIHLLAKDLKEIKKLNLSSLETIDSTQFSFNEITLKHISYSYDSDREQALSDVSVSIKRGESIGFMGSSGSGKSTLIDVLLGFLNPKSGEIKLNGKSLSEEGLCHWVSQVAYIPQQIFLIDDTLKRNVALGMEDHLIDESKVIESLRKSNLYDFVNTLPEGLETKVGERGVRLSGGQRQRIAIARSFYYERDILVMDEATSALDNETEEEIVEEIKKLKGNKTLIFIAHRLSTLKYCDRVYRLENGKVVNEGTYSEVVENTEVFDQ